MDSSITMASLLSAPVLAFVLGVLAVAIRSDLKVPDAFTQTLSIYLLLAIGLKGGVALAGTDPSSLAVPLALAIAFGLVTPVLAYLALRVLTPLGPVDRGSVAAHYGSTSLVTFTAAIVALESAKIVVPPYAATVLTVLEVPGILIGLLLARRHTARRGRWGATIHEILTGKSILLLVGGLAIGAVIGESGYASVEPFFGEPFRGALVLFLLALGIDAARRFGALRTGAVGLIAFAILFPLVVGSTAVLVGSAAGLDTGGAAILGVLCASASYIAAPAAVRMSLPDANLAYPLAASLGVTFPLNLTVGIPLFTAIAVAL
ncbi:sodium-dependent bicarbonate transport family permease [Microbacterium lacus]|uniref:Sodium-dependent bicarbonate transport family permease n=1 Tax=Microbacterium lacus TaxID=415217 RepID=A0ABP4RY07_9MICO